MARGMILILIATFFSASAMALTEVEKCARKADRLIEKAYPGRHIVREEFKNTTPGSYYQEYTGTYAVDGRTVTAEFYSPFICDDLRLTSTAE